MTKQKFSIIAVIKHCFTYHPWLKLIAFILTIMVWLYVRDEISRFNY